METAPPEDSGSPPAPASSADASEVAEPPKAFGHLTLGPRLRASLLGETFHAQDTRTGAAVAVTLVREDLSASEPAADRLHSAVKLAASLQHKSIASVLYSGREQNRLFVVSEEVAGETLRDLLERKRESQRFYSLTGACNITLHVLAALDHAHGHLAHGALCPSAVLITPDGRVKLLDFGLGALSTLFRKAPDAAALAARDAAYLAPQTAAAAPDSSADFFAVGVLLHELLSGALPSGSNLAALPKELDGIVRRCLHSDPEQRYSQARGLKDDLMAVLNAASKAASATGPVPSAPAKPPPTPSAGMQAARPPRMPTPVVGVPRIPTPIVGVPRVPTPPRPLTPIAGVPLLPKGPPTGRSQRFAVVEGGPVDETAEKWLIHKDRLDFGPFSLASVKLQIREGKFSAESIIVDQSTGQRMTIAAHPLLAATIEEAAAGRERLRREAADRAHRSAERRVRALIALVVGGVILAMGVVVLVIVKRRAPVIQEKIVYREKEQNLEGLLKGIDIAWKSPEPPKKRSRRGSAGPGAPGAPGDAYDEFDAPMELGDASQGGGDEQLSPQVIQKVMTQNFGTLTSCVLEEKRRDASLKEVQIEFLVKGTGKVAAVRTNGQRSGPLADCMTAKMKGIGFPSFNGPQTRAGFSMSLR